MKRYPNITKALMEQPWAMLPSTFAALREVVELRLEGVTLSDEEIQERISSGPGSKAPSAAGGGAIALVPIYGAIFPRANLMSAISGGTSLDVLGSTIRAAADDPQVGTILLDVNSPGGSVDLMPETVATLREARKAKPLVAVANTMAASAAYWLAAQADEVVVSPSARVGSIGVIAAHEDESVFWDQRGIKTTLITAGEHKAEANPFEPLTDDARQTIQAMVDEVYGWFVGDVAKGRSVSRKTVEADFGQGRLMGARAAVNAGLADRVGTLEETIARLSSPRRRVKAAASGQEPETDDMAATVPLSVAAVEPGGGSPSLAGLDLEVQYQQARRRRIPTGG